MKTLKKVLLAIFAVLLVGILALFIFIQFLKPQYSGKQQLTSISKEVQVYFDEYGIPHIYAEDEADAFKVLGYVHAQDRLWQMELLRRIAPGRLSEVFGEKTLNTDKFFLNLGISEQTKQIVAEADTTSQTVKLAKAYLSGINAFVDEGPTPIEYYLTGLKKSHFNLEDVYNTVGYMSFSFAMAQKTDPLATKIMNQWGAEYLKDLELQVDPTTQLIKNHLPKVSDTVLQQVLQQVAEALKPLPTPQLEGSNSWVLGPQKTKSGKVLFANDPHIGFAQPCVWYEAHIETPTYTNYGHYLAGVPFPLLAHNRKRAYGLTMFENDDIDFYRETSNPSNPDEYQTPNGFKSYKTINTSIKVKGGEEVPYRYRTTDHGPVLSNQIEQLPDAQPVSMSWTYTKTKNQVLEALYGISHANDLKSFQEALPRIHAPGLNVMYGDAEGNVAWWATAKLYQMPDSVNTKLVLDGASGKDEPLGYLDFSENPQAINPPWHYVYSANNPPDSINGRFYPGYYLPENRAKRIVQLLQPKNDWDKEAMAHMITDVTSSVDADILANLSKKVEVDSLPDYEIKLLDELGKWKGEYTMESMEPTVFTRWVYFFLRDTFEDELGEEDFKAFLETHFQKRLLAPMAQKQESVWWDNVHTKQVEKAGDIATQSYKEAIASLRKDFGGKESHWRWDKVHTLEHKHPIGEVKLLRRIFNVGPFKVPGSREVINNMSFVFDGTGFYKVSSGPSTRRIIDFSDVEHSLGILPTGESGNPFSRHYDDQAQLYVDGGFRKMLMDKAEIQKDSNSLLIFSPTDH